MNCHGGNNQDHNNHEQGKKGNGKHMLLMILCCAIPILLLLLLPVLKINSTAIKGILPFAVLLLCPLMHILPMRRKNKGAKGQEHDPYQNQEIEHMHVKQIEDSKEGI